MTIKALPQKQKTHGYRAQAMIEFAIALPVLLMLLIGIMEVGRMMLIYTMVVNASRDAVRYASAVGEGDDGFLKYKNCAGIKKAAKDSTYNFVVLSDSNISISYKDENGASAGICDQPSGEDPHITVDSEYRVTVTVSATYTRLVALIPIPSRTITSTSTRTILGIYSLPNP